MFRPQAIFNPVRSGSVPIWGLLVLVAVFHCGCRSEPSPDRNDIRRSSQPGNPVTGKGNFVLSPSDASSPGDAELSPGDTSLPSDDPPNINGPTSTRTSTLDALTALTGSEHEIALDRKVTAAEFDRICQLTDLETLKLDGGGVSAEQVGALHRLMSLEHLRIRNCPVNDDGIVELVKLRNLRVLNLPQADFSDRALKMLANLPKLELLRFSSKQVTDAGIRYLENSKSLRALHLIRVPITDRSVDSFCRIKTLESLYLDGSSLTDEGFSQILQQRPDLHLHVDQVHLDYDPNRH